MQRVVCVRYVRSLSLGHTCLCYYYYYCRLWLHLRFAAAHSNGPRNLSQKENPLRQNEKVELCGRKKKKSKNKKKHGLKIKKKQPLSWINWPQQPHCSVLEPQYTLSEQKTKKKKINLIVGFWEERGGRWIIHLRSTFFLYLMAVQLACLHIKRTMAAYN